MDKHVREKKLLLKIPKEQKIPNWGEPLILAPAVHSTISKYLNLHEYAVNLIFSPNNREPNIPNVCKVLLSPNSGINII